jgi:hypothetical protein
LKKLAIVGSGHNTRSDAPFDDLSFDIWVFNEAAQSEWCKRWSACFQMHEPEIYTGHNTKNANHWPWLQETHGKPIYMQERDERVPDSVAYPLDEAKALAGVQMFTTSFAYMAALAILQGYEEIRIYGVELSASEYEYQASGYLFWFGFLRGRLGADKVDSAVLYLDKNIFTAPLYGYEGNAAFGKDYFIERVKVLEVQWQAAEKNARNVRKAIDRAIEKREADKVVELVKDLQNIMTTSGEHAGALSEAERYSTFGDRYADRGGFELQAATAQQNGEYKKSLMFHAGGKVEYVWNVWKQQPSQAAEKQLQMFINQTAEAAYDMGAQLGCYTENIGYMMKYDEIVKAGGAVLL